ncbi:MAG: hypothetical protein ABWY25_12335 [Paenisporosarcina sp.]
MTVLVWDQIGERFYETGISKGVFYGVDGLGTAWNGLTSVEERVSNDVQPIYFDGIKFNDIVTVGDFSAVLRAFTYPDKFLPYEGVLQDQSGFYITNQPQIRFGLSYQTRVGDDIVGLDRGYKIHILYNLTAIPMQKSYQTMSLDTVPFEFEWDLTAIPEEIENFRPTAHVILDSRHIDQWLLQDLEDILYGDEDSDAQLPPLKGLAAFIRKWDRLIIIDNGDGTWTAETPRPGVITMLDETTFEITADTAVYIDSDSYTITSSDKNDEDIWLP